jgi:hypothetical protein
LSLLARVSAVLDAAGIRHAVIGASALAVHGVARSTLDQDLLALEPGCLAPGLWEALRAEGVGVEIRRGDWSDPLAGLVRFAAPGERPVDLVVGKLAWQRRALDRARPFVAETPPVIAAADLILLKLYAGGPQDAWDIQQLLAVADADRDHLIREVERELTDLPAGCSELWRRIRDEA